MRGTIAILALALAASIGTGRSPDDGAQKRETPAQILGRVLDSEGEPLSGVTVIALRSRVRDGVRENLISKTATTNDRGEYRIARLPPDDYLVQAAGFSGAEMYLGDDAPAPNTHETFEPTYFGGTHAADTAARIALEPGSEARADFLLELKPGRLIRGRITNLVPYHPAVLQLLRGGEDAAVSRSSINTEDGRFQIHGVLDGTYRLRAVQFDPSEEMAFADQRVEIRGKDLDGLEIRLSPGLVMKGTVRLDPPAEDGEEYGGVELRLDLLDTFRREAPGALVFRSHEIDNGEFEIRSLIPGRYRPRFEPYGALYVKSAKAGATDLLATPELALGPDPPPPVEIVLSMDGGTVGGTVAAQSRGAGHPLLLLAAETMARPPLIETADDDDNFSFDGVAPGVYRLHAWSESAQVEYGAPRVLRMLAATGERVEVKPGREVTVRLQGLSEAPR
jgi:hypothetical protein